MLEVKDLNISLTSGKSVAEHISFQLGQGEMLSIVDVYKRQKVQSQDK